MFRLARGGVSQSLLPLVLAVTATFALACNSSDELKKSNEDSPTQSPPPTAPPVDQPTVSENLSGQIGASTQWDSGWIDLKTMTSLKRGDKLRVRVGGSAHTILVRFLGKGDNPNDPVGIEGGTIEVPKDRVVELVLQEDHEDVVQISVHGGPNPWNLYPMGGDNGPATILSVERIAS